MNPIPQPPESHDSDDKLSPELQRATDAIRNAPVPHDAVDRATDRATTIPKVNPARPGGYRGFFIAMLTTAVAVMVAVGAWTFGLYPGAKPAPTNSPEQVASHQGDPSKPREQLNRQRGSVFTQPNASQSSSPDGTSATSNPIDPVATTGIPSGPVGSPVPTGEATGGTPGYEPKPKPVNPTPQPVPGPGTGGSPIRNATKDIPAPTGYNQGTGAAIALPSNASPEPGYAPPRPSVPPGLLAKPAPPVLTAPSAGSATPFGSLGGALGPQQQGQQGQSRPGELRAVRGRVTQQLRDFAQTWGSLPGAERAKREKFMLQNLPPKHREAAQKYFRAVADAKKAGQPAPPAPAIAVVPAAAPGGEGLGTEDYNHYHDNPYQAVALKPLSTFSIAVDTASYSNIRRFLTTEKRLPPADAVRVAELVNYFPYAYPQPTGEHPVSITANVSQCPWTPKHHLLRVALKAKEFAPGKMPPRNFVFLLDTSGSMRSANKLPLLKKSLRLLVETLNGSDRIAIVVYASAAGLVLPSTPGDEKDKILKALDNLGAGGSTNGGAGIQLAYKVAQENAIEGGLNRVILGTDGDFNVGTTGANLVRTIEEKRKTGVYLSILGFGMGNYKSGMMEKLSKHGNGTHGYIDNLDEAKKLFVEQGGALVTVAKDVKLQLEFNPQMVAGYRLIGYENRILQDQDFNDDTKDASEMGAGHTVTALYEIVPVGQPVPDVDVDPLKYQQPKETTPEANTGEWLIVKLRYKDPEEETSKLLEHPLTGGVVAFDKSPEDFRFAASVASFGMLLRKSKYAGKTTLAATKEIAASSLGDDPNGHRKAFLDLVEAADKLSKAAKNANE